MNCFVWVFHGAESPCFAVVSLRDNPSYPCLSKEFRMRKSQGVGGVGSQMLTVLLCGAVRSHLLFSIPEHDGFQMREVGVSKA